MHLFFLFHNNVFIRKNDRGALLKFGKCKTIKERVETAGNLSTKLSLYLPLGLLSLLTAPALL